MKTLIPERVAPAAAAGHRKAPYACRTAVLATMHGKQKAIVPVLRDRLGLIVSSPPDIDTDALGTFTGEIPRAGTIRKAAVAKARLGMAATGLPIGVASEGSYGPHPQIPFIPGGVELMVLVDDTRGIVVSEHLIDDAPVFGHAYVAHGDALTPILDRLGFPGHALIVKPAESDGGAAGIHKGLPDRTALERAVMSAQAQSNDRRALIQTDMRAHMNPTRMATLGRLASVLAERLSTMCPVCGIPGYGLVDVETGLPCDLCGTPSLMVRHRVFACVTCPHEENRPRGDGLTRADPGHCPFCNP